MFNILVHPHLPSDSPLKKAANALDFLEPYARWLGARDKTLSRWFLAAGSLEEALQYEAFAKGYNGHEATKAILTARYAKSTEPVIVLWNGEDSADTGAGLVLSIVDSVYTSELDISLDGPPGQSRIGGWKSVAELVALAVVDLRPEYASVQDRTAYFKKKVFPDRPGVGWMLYLPRTLSAQDVPEAEALVPVMEGKTQLGTIMVSVTDTVFDELKPEHVKRSNAIETRLVSQDMLPTWTQLMRPS